MVPCLPGTLQTGFLASWCGMIDSFAVLQLAALQQICVASLYLLTPPCLPCCCDTSTWLHQLYYWTQAGPDSPAVKAIQVQCCMRTTKQATVRQTKSLCPVQRYACLPGRLLLKNSVGDSSTCLGVAISPTPSGGRGGVPAAGGAGPGGPP